MHRSSLWVVGIALLVGSVALPPPTFAVTSSAAVASKFSANGHNVSFDGRLHIGRDETGWVGYMLRPEAVTYRADGLPNAMGSMWSDRKGILLGGDEVEENALAICEPDPSRAPYRCDDAGAASSGGAFDCYDVWLIDSDASRDLAAGGSSMRRRRVTIWVSDPKTEDAVVAKHRWDSEVEPLATTAAGPLSGIEPTLTRDGKLMIWNSVGSVTRDVEELVYSTNATPCGATGWSPPRSLSHMIADPVVSGTYRLAERPLRRSDGTPLADGDPVHGAYPWLFPDGEAVFFIATPLPCRGVEDPSGCGPRRQMAAVLGYPTNWGISLVDGAVNPDTDETARLFFSSPGPETFPQLPVTPGRDVWPFFGSNTANYVEVSFDDGLDGNYAAYWHMNEGVDAEGFLDGGQVPDVSGYFNTARVLAPVPARNLLGAPRAFTGLTAGDSIAHEASQSPSDRITLELTVKPTASPDCDAENNFRLLVAKNGAYFMALEENRRVGVHFIAVGGADYFIDSGVALPIGVATKIAVTYDGATGVAAFFVNGIETRRESFAPALLATSTDPLLVGGPSGTPPACPAGAGGFAGELDGLDVSTRAYASGVTRLAASDGVIGRSLVFDGVFGHLEVAHAASLQPVNALTLEMAVRPTVDPDCDAGSNHRILLQKGAGYSLILEDDRAVRARVQVTGGAIYELLMPAPLPLDVWSHVGLSYDGATGEMVFYLDGVVVARGANAPATLAANTEPLLIGGPAVAEAACPTTGGGFAGTIDEVAISRIARDLTPPPAVVPDAGVDNDAGDPPVDPSEGGCCRIGRTDAPAGGTLLLLALAMLVLTRRRPGT